MAIAAIKPEHRNQALFRRGLIYAQGGAGLAPQPELALADLKAAGRAGLTAAEVAQVGELMAKLQPTPTKHQLASSPAGSRKRQRL